MTQPPAPAEARDSSTTATVDRTSGLARPATRHAIRVLGGYAVFGVAWILLSDRMLLAVAPDMASLSTLGLWKGLAFVLLSTLLLFLLMIQGSPALDATARDREPEAESRSATIATAWLWGLFAVAAAAIVGVGLVGVGTAASDLRENDLADLRAFTRTQVQAVSAWRAARLCDAQAQGNDSVLEAMAREWRLCAASSAHAATTNTRKTRQ